MEQRRVKFFTKGALIGAVVSAQKRGTKHPPLESVVSLPELKFPVTESVYFTQLGVVRCQVIIDMDLSVDDVLVDVTLDEFYRLPIMVTGGADAKKE